MNYCSRRMRVLLGILLLTAKEYHGALYHSPRHQCLPDGVMSFVPVIYKVNSKILCAMKCTYTRCLFFEFSDNGGAKECKIYGEGKETKGDGNYYINTDNAAPTPDGPLYEIAKRNTSTAYCVVTSQSAAVNLPLDDDKSSFFEALVSYPWWMVDIDAFYFIYRLEVLPRGGYFQYRFGEAEFRVGAEFRDDGDLTSWNLIGSYLGPYAESQGSLQFNSNQGICGRYMALNRPTDDPRAFSIADVEVFVRLRGNQQFLEP